MRSAWQTIRIFVSSTFLDMQSERDVLEQIVFPALREKLLLYHTYLDTIDLRWGVTDEQVKDQLALEVCLDRIDQARPYFLGMLGGRYGDPIGGIKPETLLKHGWLEGLQDKSVTDLEFRYGLSASGGKKSNAIILLRDDLQPDGALPELALVLAVRDAEQGAKLTDLKKWVAANAPAENIARYCCEFAGIRVAKELISLKVTPENLTRISAVLRDNIVPPDGLRRLPEDARRDVFNQGTVYMDGLERFAALAEELIWKVIEPGVAACLPANRTPLPLDDFAADAELETRFIELQTRVFIGRDDIIRELFEFVEGDAAGPLFISGPEGSGKSAVLANFCVSLLENPGKTLVLRHFCGVSPQSGRLDFLLKKLCGQLLEHFRFTDKKDHGGTIQETPVELETTTETLISQFNDLVGRIPGGKKVVLLLDGLDGLEDFGQPGKMNWFPKSILPNVRIILTGEDSEFEGAAVAALFRLRPCLTLRLPDLATADRIAIARTRSALSGRELSDHQHVLLTGNPATGNPLFLYIALEELKNFNAAKQLADRISLLPAGEGAIPALITQLIKRSENDFGKTLTSDVLTLLTSSRKGLAERELTGLLDFDGKKDQGTLLFYPLLRQLRPYLQYKGELLSFFHPCFPETIAGYFLNTPEQRLDRSLRLARYFEQQNNVRRLEELPWHLIRVVRDESSEEKKAPWLAKLFDLLRDAAFLEAKTGYDVNELLGDLAAAGALFPAASLPAKVLDFVRKNILEQKNWLQRHPAGIAALLYNNSGTGFLSAATAKIVSDDLFRAMKDSKRPFLLLEGDRVEAPFEKVPFSIIPMCGVYTSTGRCIAADYNRVEIWDPDAGLDYIKFRDRNLPQIIVEESPVLFIVYFRGGDPDEGTQSVSLALLDLENKTLSDLMTIKGYWLVALRKSGERLYNAVTREGDFLAIDLNSASFRVTGSARTEIGAAFIEANGEVTFVPPEEHTDFYQADGNELVAIRQQFLDPIPIFRWDPVDNLKFKLGEYQNAIEDLIAYQQKTDNLDVIVSGFSSVVVLHPNLILLVSELGKIVSFFPSTNEFFGLYTHTHPIESIDVLEGHRLMLTSMDSVILDLRRVSVQQAAGNRLFGTRMEAIAVLPDDQVLVATPGRLWVHDVFTRQTSSLQKVPRLGNLKQIVFLPDGSMLPLSNFKGPSQVFCFERIAKRLDNVNLTNMTVNRLGELTASCYQKASNGYLAKRYDSKNYRFEGSTELPEHTYCIAAREDGVYGLALEGKQTLALWDPRTKKIDYLGVLNKRAVDLGFTSEGEFAACDLGGTLALWDKEGENVNVCLLGGQSESMCCHWHTPAITVALNTGELVTHYTGKDRVLKKVKRTSRKLPLYSRLGWSVFIKGIWMAPAMVLLMNLYGYFRGDVQLVVAIYNFFLYSAAITLLSYPYYAIRVYVIRLKIVLNRRRRKKVRAAPAGISEQEIYRQHPLNVRVRYYEDSDIKLASMAGMSWFKYVRAAVKLFPLVICLALFVYNGRLSGWLSVLLLIFVILYAARMLFLAWYKFYNAAGELVGRRFAFSPEGMPIWSMDQGNPGVSAMKLADHRNLLYGLFAIVGCFACLVLRIFGLIQTADFRFLYLAFAAVIIILRGIYSGYFSKHSRMPVTLSSKIAERIARIGM